jgi:hypothetical protein
MGTDQLGRLLADAAAGVPEPAVSTVAEQAWARSRRIRHRRLGAGSALTVAVLLGAAALVGPGPSGEPPTADPTDAVGAPVTDRIPETLTERTGVPLPRDPDFGRSDIAGLSERPVARAVALYEPAVDTAGSAPGPVYVLGDDGAFRRLDVVTLQFAVDSAGRNPIPPLNRDSLSPSGKLAAFPQRDSVVVVDLTTARVDRYSAPGFNQEVGWWGDDKTLMVGQAVGTSGPEPGTVGSHEIRLTTGMVMAHEYFIGPAENWSQGDRAVRASRTVRPIVLDVGTNRVVRTLAVRPDQHAVLGWFDASTVLVHTDRGVLAWDVDTGQVSAVTAPFNGVIALPPQWAR